ncbi:MAG TPA: histidine phosphatase family protein [Albitalea sp.]|nr:histidine phosphatase family protein [Albitalea sp.]
MKNIYLVRHGESLANIRPELYQEMADHAVPLSDRGQRQATAAGAALRDLIRIGTDEALRVWHSPYKRTRQTADALCAELAKDHPHLDRREHINLCEQQFGLFDGVPEDELPERFPLEHAHYARAETHEGRFWARMPLGESRFDVAVRVHQAFGTFHRDAERHGVRNIVVVCHGVTLRAFVMQWLHMPYEWFDAQKNPGNCDIYHLPATGEGGYVYRGGAVT